MFLYVYDMEADGAHAYDTKFYQYPVERKSKKKFLSLFSL